MHFYMFVDLWRLHIVVEMGELARREKDAFIETHFILFFWIGAATIAMMMQL